MGQYQVKNLSGRHMEAMRMLAVGVPTREVADITGLSVWTISRVRNSEKGKAFMAKIHHMLDRYVASHLATQGFLRKFPHHTL